MSARGYLLVVCLAALMVIVGCSSQSDTDYSSHNTDESPNLDNLQGMFYGFRDDFGGEECGGMCWDFYTFLPNKKVILGLPVNGGPETIDCKEDECLDYSISNGQLKLENGESFPIELDDETLIINNIKLDSAQPVQEGTTFDNEYKYIGYYGLVGVTGSSSSWTYYLSLQPDGKFELSGVTLGSVGANSGTSTHASSSDETDKGTYKVKNNTITMTSSDGTVKNLLFLIHDSDVTDIQLGEKNYYVDED